MVRWDISSVTPSKRVAWIHFGVLLALAGALEALTVGLGPRAADAEFLWLLGEAGSKLYQHLPIVGGIAVVMLPVDRAVRRQALLVVACVLAFMFVSDMLTSWTTLIGRPGFAVTRQGEIAAMSGISFATVPMVSTFARWMGGELLEVGELLRQYPAAHDRIVASAAVQKLGVLLLAPILAGLSAGLTAWIHQRVSFKSRTDERVALLVVAWLIAPVAYWVALRWSGDMRTAALFRGQSLMWILLPYIPLAAIGGLGWRFLWLTTREAGGRDREP